MGIISQLSLALTTRGQDTVYKLVAGASPMLAVPLGARIAGRRAALADQAHDTSRRTDRGRAAAVKAIRPVA